MENRILDMSRKEDNRPQWKTTVMEDDFHGRQPQWKMIHHRRQPFWKMTSMEDNPMQNYLNER